jgi:hypothetical protein
VNRSAPDDDRLTGTSGAPRAVDDARIRQRNDRRIERDEVSRRAGLDTRAAGDEENGR